MAAKLGITRAAVWKQIRNLRRRGYEIEASTKKGYHLTYKPDLLDADLIRSGLKTKWLGRDLYSFSEVNSTTRWPNPWPPVAQTAPSFWPRPRRKVAADCPGPGHPHGGIWMSLILKPEMPLASVYQINMAICVAVSKAIFSLLGLEAGIKCPMIF